MMRRLNQVRVLRVIRAEQGLSRARIASITDLSKVTVSEVVVDLMATDLVSEELEPEDSRSGRPGPRPRVLFFRSDSQYVIGVDIGAAKALILVTDLAGRTVAEHRISTAQATSRSAVIDLVRAAIQASLHSAGVEPDKVVAMGVGTPGVVNPVSGVVEFAPQLPGWEGFSLADELSISDGCAVIVANEVQLAVLAEQWRGMAQGLDNAAYLHIGVGAGLGYIVDGEIYRGARGAAGEIGYLPLRIEDDEARPKLTGRFEWMVGGPAYVRRAEKLLASGTAPRLQTLANEGKLDARAIYAAAAVGDPHAQAVIDETIGVTALGVAGIVAVLDPEIVIVGGGISGAGDAFIKPLAEMVSAYVPRMPRFAVASLGDRVVAVGAVRMALEHWEANLFALT